MASTRPLNASAINRLALSRRSGYLVVAGRGLLLFHHAAGVVARGSECFAGFRVAEIRGQFIQHAACRNDITVTVAFGDIPKCLHRLFKGLFVTQSSVGVPANLLRAFFCVRDDASSVAGGLGQHSLGLLSEFFGFLQRLSAVVGCGTTSFLDQGLGFLPEALGFGQRIGEEALGLSFRLSEVFVFPQGIELLQGLGDKRFRCDLGFVGFRLVVLPAPARTPVFVSSSC